MQTIVRDFLDEYDMVNSACGEKLSCHFGIENYCNQMESAKNRNMYFGTEWNSTYRSLKHFNLLYHQISYYGTPYVLTGKDLEEIKAFHQKLLDGADPLSVIGIGENISSDPENENINEEQKTSYFKKPATKGGDSLSSAAKFLKNLTEAAIVIVAMYFLFK